MSPDFNEWLRVIHCAVLTQHVNAETMSRLQGGKFPVLDLSRPSALHHGLYEGGHAGPG